MVDRLVAVALPLPFQSTFSYRVPESLPLPERGARVLVPFSARRVVGVALGPGALPPGTKLADVLDVVDESPLLAPPLLDLALWVGEHYLAPPGECLRLAVPPMGVRSSRALVRLTERGASVSGEAVVDALRRGPLPVSTLSRRLGRDPSAAVARLRRAGMVVVEQDLESQGFRTQRIVVLAPDAPEPKGQAQRAVVSQLRAQGGRVVLSELVREHPSWRSAVASLARSGVVGYEDQRVGRAPAVMAGDAAVRPASLSAGQAEAVSAIVERVEESRFETFLLYGVTGSGKTEVYFRAAERTLAAGRGVLILVPEIALTPVLVRAAVARFGATVALLHSDLSRGERHDEWWRIRDGEARVVIGARSAVFAPIPDLGLIVVDEEHEGAYKQEEAPRYHGRDVAVMRAKLEGVPIVLGSATPSVESYWNALQGRYRLLRLPSRIGSTHGLPEIEIIDRREILRQGQDPVLTPRLLTSIEGRVARGEQVLLLLNRRGYAQCLLCRECGAQAACRNCSVSLTVHERGRLVQCHYCGYECETPVKCEGCGGEYLRFGGYGTERVLERVKEAVPSARVERLDRDLARRRGAIERVLADFESGAIDVLVGTQMIAKGHDFPNVTLVGVIDADVGLGLPDFRSAERTFQLLTQVAGRAGRGQLKGLVVLQSHLPDHYALVHACEQDFMAFFEREMEFRRTMSYPPQAALVNIVVRSEDGGHAADEARALAAVLRGRAPGAFRLLGPAAAPLSKLQKEFRYQILLKGRRAAMRAAVKDALVQRYGHLRWPGVSVDVDPVSLM
jgi:primosomal protein N' (replication factor Y)